MDAEGLMRVQSKHTTEKLSEDPRFYARRIDPLVPVVGPGSWHVPVDFILILTNNSTEFVSTARMSRDNPLGQYKKQERIGIGTRTAMIESNMAAVVDPRSDLDYTVQQVKSLRPGAYHLHEP